MRLALPILAALTLGACAHKVNHLGPMASTPGDGVAFADGGGGSLLLATAAAQEAQGSSLNLSAADPLCVQDPSLMGFAALNQSPLVPMMMDPNLLDRNVLTPDQLQLLEPDIREQLLDPRLERQPMPLPR